MGQPVSGQFEINLASNYTEKINVCGFFSSPKLDGLRCIWNGKELYTRIGRKLAPPSFFTSNFPSSPLDGELYSSRGIHHLFESLASEDASSWLGLTYWVFDAPGINLQFRQRLDAMKRVIDKDILFMKLMPFEMIRDKCDVEKKLGEAVEKGLEGLVLRNPASIYERKRSWGWLKVKRQFDMEVKVLGLVQVARRKYGKNIKSKLKQGLLVEAEGNGMPVRFRLLSGLTNDQSSSVELGRMVGKILTIKYCGLRMNGVPRQPVFMREFLSM